MTDFALFAGLRPELAALALAHRERCEQHGLPLVFLSGRRTPAEQMALYEKGRKQTPAGTWVVDNPPAVVTWAMPGHSPHELGAAYDCAPVFHERIDWTRLDLFQAMATLMPRGLVWGGAWPRIKDLPHFELADWRTLS